MYKEIDGDLIVLAKQGMFDVIAHGCNCFCRMKRGIAPQMAEAFHCNDPKYFNLERDEYIGDINKLGQIEYDLFLIAEPDKGIWIVNAYTQYDWRGEKPLDYNALALCLKKINHKFAGQHIGLPKIGAGLAGGNWTVIKIAIETLLSDCDVTVVNYKP